MALFAIADLHLSLGSEKPMDIFRGWEDYQQRLEKNWRSAVSSGDTVVLPGDLSWGMSLEESLADFAFIESLPGKKIILKGNHDYWWSTRRKMEDFFTLHGFTTLTVLHNSCVPVGGVCVCGSRGWFFDETEGSDKKVLLREAGRLDTSLRLGAQTGLETVAFLHYPPVYGSFECPEIMDVLIKYGVKRCYYGHLHGRAARTAFEGESGGVSFRLVSADRLGFAPLLVDKA
jgi:predicted phosphohydrolase